jgi:hypothetical protein
MKYIIVIDGVESTRYKYNVWTTHKYEEGNVSEDTRIFCSDNLHEFVDFMAKIDQHAQNEKLFANIQKVAREQMAAQLAEMVEKQ